MTPVTFPTSLIRSTLLVGVALLANGVALAEKADKDKPMNIEADALRYDDARQTSIFSGKVLITKGTITMRGDSLRVRQDDQGNQRGVLVGKGSNPGFFRQKREGLDEYIEGEGNKIVYDSQKQTVTFTGQAVLRRFRGAQLNDESAGNEIVYNSETEVFTVKGGKGAQTESNPSGRVRAMLTPIPQDKTSEPSAPPAQLKSSEKLNEKTP
ncbi:lipopolysaccharide transport periplasmic protein LptA [Hydrogenophaga sp. 5NK40-0174]|uniref:lipopolysaccharide transport periplasmic protein LptA n=1 Tax=Hydrogenophaga sp. 5NK40-0174 TaxID=3127649 RepID=UPI0033410434